MEIKINWHKQLVMMIMFFSGACGLVLEHIQGTLGVTIFGNPTVHYVLVYGTMMAAMGWGANRQASLKDENMIERLFNIELLLATIGPFSVIGSVYLHSYLNKDIFLYVHMIFIIILGYLIGQELPVMGRIYKNDSKSLGENYGTVLSADYVGSLAGALFFAFVLVRYFPLVKSPYIIGGMNFSIIVMGYFYYMKRGMVKRPKLYFVLMLATVFLLFFGYYNSYDWGIESEQRMYRAHIWKKIETKFGNHVWTREKINGETVIVYNINGHPQYSSRDSDRYHESFVHMPMSVVRDPQRVLILGGGDGLALAEVLKYKSVKEVLLVELDPVVVKAHKEDPDLARLNNYAFFNSKVTTLESEAVTAGVLESQYRYSTKFENGKNLLEKIAEVRVMHIDAALFLDELIGKWDVILIDFPDPHTPDLAKLYTEQFYWKVRSILSEKGMMVIQSSSPYYAKEAYLCIKRTVESAGFHTIPYHENVPIWGDWGWIAGVRDSNNLQSVKNKINSIERLSVETDYYTPEVMRAQMVFGRDCRTGKPYFESAKFDGINRNFDMVLLNYYLKHGSW